MKRFISSNERGQSSMEFMVISVVFVALLLFHVTLSLVFMSSSFLDYAAYMSGRTATTTAQPGGGSGLQAFQNRFRRIMSTYLRVDSEPSEVELDSREVFFNPVLTLQSDAAASVVDALVPSALPRDPEQIRNPGGLPSDKVRNNKVSFRFNHAFLLGSAFIPMGEDMSFLRGASISHYFRREPRIDECRDTFFNKSNQAFGAFGSDAVPFEGMADNGC